MPQCSLCPTFYCQDQMLFDLWRVIRLSASHNLSKICIKYSIFQILCRTPWLVQKYSSQKWLINIFNTEAKFKRCYKPCKLQFTVCTKRETNWHVLYITVEISRILPRCVYTFLVNLHISWTINVFSVRSDSLKTDFLLADMEVQNCS